MPHTIRELWGRISEIFDSGGGLSRCLDDFEPRTGQREMAEMIYQALMQECIALVEAGTGTGKTMAYLIPAVFVSLALKEPVVVSTKTINLQEQIIHKDVPILQSATGEHFTTVLVKGWGNYLCLRRFYSLEVSGELFNSEELMSLNQVREWIKTTVTGDRSDMAFEVEPRVWDLLKAEPPACAFKKCPWYEKCFFFIQRKKVKDANIIVTNHALLFSHVAAKMRTLEGYRGVLPDFKRLVMDEAHHIEEVASDFLGEEASSAEFHKVLSTLYRSRSGTKSGLLPRMHKMRAAPSVENRIRNVLDTYLIPRLQTLREAFNSFSYTLAHWEILEKDSDRILIDDAARKKITPQMTDSMNSLVKSVNEYKKQLEKVRAEGVDADRDMTLELDSVICRIEAFRDALIRIWNGGEESMIYTLDYSRKGRLAFFTLKTYPLSVAETLYEQVFHPMKTVVLTSATLAINRNFKFLSKRLGLETLDDDMVLSGIIESPFEFKKQALLAIPDDMPMPDADNFAAMTTVHMATLIKAMHGRTFVLFTSYKMLKKCAEMLREKLDSSFNILVQGESPRHVLLQDFKRLDNAVLLGTDSFWEGVDVPGRDLECVIIMKLPFRVPSDPVIKARTEFIRKQGANPFLSYHVPQAIIRFKQGFGRLIRNRKDRGVIVMMDRRIIERRYGKVFLNSLPRCTVLRGSFARIIDAVGGWMKKYHPEAGKPVSGDSKREVDSRQEGQ